MNSNSSGLSRQVLILIMLMASTLSLIWVAGCTSAPSVTPEKFVLNFIQKSIPMIDKSVAEFYVKEEQEGVIDRVQKFVSSLKEKGSFQSVSTATYDFSNLKVNVLDQREEYIDDEAVDFMKVSVKDNYTKTLNGELESLIEDEIIILESVSGNWKVTEKIDPWKS